MFPQTLPFLLPNIPAYHLSQYHTFIQHTITQWFLQAKPCARHWKTCWRNLWNIDSNKIKADLLKLVSYYFINKMKLIFSCEMGGRNKSCLKNKLDVDKLGSNTWHMNGTVFEDSKGSFFFFLFLIFLHYLAAFYAGVKTFWDELFSLSFLEETLFVCFFFDILYPPHLSFS